MKPTGGVMVLQQVDPVTSFQHLDLSWKPFLKVYQLKVYHMEIFMASIVCVG